MFIFTAKVPRRRVFLPAVLIVLGALAALLLLRGGDRQGGEAEARLETNEARVAYLAARGWEAAPEPIEALRLTLPDELVEPYRSYNELQLRQGFDLTPFLGKTLERYTYAVKNYPGRPRGCQADLYLYDGRVVGGDVVCTGEHGFIDTLDFPTEAAE